MKLLASKQSSVALIIATMLVITACGSGASGNEGATSATETPANAAKSPATGAETAEPNIQDEGTLTVYLNDFDDIIADMFQAATGYKVDLVTGNGAEIMSRVEAERGNPHWDVLWMDAMPSIHGLGQSGQLMEGWAPDNLDNLTDFAKGFLPEGNWYVPTGAHAAGVIVYNSNKLSAEDAPRTWVEFADAKYNGTIGMADPAIAAPAFPFVSWFFNQKGMDDGKSFFSGLMDNGLKVYPKNPNVVSALTAGEVTVAALQESNAYAMKNNNEPIEIIWPEEGAPASVRVAAIQKDTRNPNAAKAFVEFLLDPETQRQLIEEGDESYFQPSVNGVDPKQDRSADAKLVAAEASWASQHEAEIKQWFADQSVK